MHFNVREPEQVHREYALCYRASVVHMYVKLHICTIKSYRKITLNSAKRIELFEIVYFEPCFESAFLA